MMADLTTTDEHNVISYSVAGRALNDASTTEPDVGEAVDAITVGTLGTVSPPSTLVRYCSEKKTKLTRMIVEITNAIRVERDIQGPH